MWHFNRHSLSKRQPMWRACSGIGQEMCQGMNSDLFHKFYGIYLICRVKVSPVVYGAEALSSSVWASYCEGFCRGYPGLRLRFFIIPLRGIKGGFHIPLSAPLLGCSKGAAGARGLGDGQTGEAAGNGTRIPRFLLTS